MVKLTGWYRTVMLALGAMAGALVAGAFAREPILVALGGFAGVIVAAVVIHFAKGGGGRRRRAGGGEYEVIVEY
jgi:hypothetical protein